MHRKESVSIIIPAFNEESGIYDTLAELLSFSQARQWEIIVVNDGSTDKTSSILKGFSAIRTINHPYNKGYGASLKTGIRNATGDIIVLFDADGQHRPEDIPALLEKLPHYDLAVGKRTKDSAEVWIRKPGKYILQKVANMLTGYRIPDLNCGLRTTKRSLITPILELFSDSFSFSTTSTIAYFKLGYNVCYVPVTIRKRAGHSTVKQVKHGMETIMLILRLIMLFSPLKIFVNISAFLFSLGLLYQILTFIFYGAHIVNGALLLILSGILTFMFGLLADQQSSLRLSMHKQRYRTIDYNAPNHKRSHDS